MYIKITNHNGWGTVFPGQKVTWGPALKSDAEAATEGDKYLNKDTLEFGVVTHLLIEDEHNVFVDVTEYDIYLLGDDGKTVDRIP